MSLGGLWTAIRFLTRLPSPPARGGTRSGAVARSNGRGDARDAGGATGRAASPEVAEAAGAARRLGAAAPWFPVAGALVGAVAALASGLAGDLWPAPVPAAAAVAAGLWASGGLHLDGLMDVADGLASGAPPERARAILRDSRVGALGAAAGATALLLRFALVAALAPPARWPALVVAAAAARSAIVCAASMRPRPLRGTSGNPVAPVVPDGGTGLGSAFAAGLGRLAWVGALGVATALAALLDGPRGLLAVGVAAGTAALAAGWLRRRLGALTGDGLGAAAEWAEWAALAVLAARTAVPVQW